MGRIHRFLGLEVGVILSNLTPAERRQAYAADITYGTNNEFGFDYLRDNMAWSKDEMVQRGHSFAVVDEVDSILIDEARTPLIISGPADQATTWYAEFARIVNVLKRDEDYEVDEKKRTIGVLEQAIDKVEDQIGIDNLYDTVNTPLVGFLNNAIKAKELFKRDRDYVVTNGEVIIVDEHTGRILPGRRYNEGLHQVDRGQGGRRGQGREPDAGHRHPPELLPPVRQALRDDRHGHDRGRGVQPDLQPRCRADPDEPRHGPGSTTPTWSSGPLTRSTTRSSRTSPSGTRPASRSWWARRASRSPSCCRSC